MNEKYGEEIQFIIAYTIDAHPAGSNSPYVDREWTASFSTDLEGNPVEQPSSYQDRIDLARKTSIEAGIKTLILVDEIDNPIWCTYGPAPNIAYLVGTDGKIVFKQGWYDPVKMEKAILDYIENTD